MKHTTGFLYLCLFILLTGFLPIQAEAVVRTSDDLLVFSPPAPGPETSTVVSLADASLLSLGAKVRWFIDGVEQTNDQDSLSTTFTTKGVGEVTEVLAEFSVPGNGPVRSKATVAPTRIDLIIGADSYVPSFYLGRALPGRASEISARAHVFGDDSGPYQYYWRIGSTNFNDSPRSNMITYRPTLTSQVLFQLRVENDQGELVGETSTVVDLVRPEIHFYESNPLHGLIPVALQSPYNLIKQELTIRGEPFYVSGSLNDLALEWTIDNGDVEGDVDNPLQLSIEKTTNTGTARVGLDLINRNGFVEDAEASIKIQF